MRTIMKIYLKIVFLIQTVVIFKLFHRKKDIEYYITGFNEDERIYIKPKLNRRERKYNENNYFLMPDEAKKLLYRFLKDNKIYFEWRNKYVHYKNPDTMELNNFRKICTLPFYIHTRDFMEENINDEIAWKNTEKRWVKLIESITSKNWRN